MLKFLLLLFGSARASSFSTSTSTDLKNQSLNVLLIIIDNLRPELGFAESAALTPSLDTFASESIYFSRAFCQIAWCAPSRNSFLSGRRPDTTKAYGFVDHFREDGIGRNWTSLPQYFKQHGYRTASIGKVFHPHLPPNNDYPKSWTELPIPLRKAACPNETMTCAYKMQLNLLLEEKNDPSGVKLKRSKADPKNSAVEVSHALHESTSRKHALFVDPDRICADEGIRKLTAFSRDIGKRRGSGEDGEPPGFFLSLGFQSARLPWTYPEDVPAEYKYPPASDIPIATHMESPGPSQNLEWFRPTEVNLYSDIRNVTHDQPMEVDMQHAVRRAYLSAISHIDDQVGRVLDALEDLKLAESTLVAITSDHGQNLGEHNLWSMMSNAEASLRVPLLIRTPATKTSRRPMKSPAALYTHPVELVDLFPTLAGAAGLDLPPFSLPGTDLSSAMLSNIPVKPINAAFSQITRCSNCSRAYDLKNGGSTECRYDRTADSAFYVPCCVTNRTMYDYMGMSVRTEEWRYTLWCGWDGQTLSADWSNCTQPELFDHRNDTELFNVDDWENNNCAGLADYQLVEAEMKALLRRGFDS